MTMTAKQRGCWPYRIRSARPSQSVSITFSMDRSLYDWLAKFVGDHNFFPNVEETLITAVRCMAGTDHPHGRDIGSLAQWVGEAREVKVEKAMYRDIAPTAHPDKVRALLWAARLAAAGDDFPGWELPETDEMVATVRSILAALEIEPSWWDNVFYDSEELEKQMRLYEEEALQSTETTHDKKDSDRDQYPDDDIPF